MSNIDMSLALTVWEWRYLEAIFTKDESVSEGLKYISVCKTAPATPGLLIVIYNGWYMVCKLLGEIDVSLNIGLRILELWEELA